MLFQVCDPPETIGIGIIQPDETKTYIKKQENARGFLMDKLTKLPTPPHCHSGGSRNPVFSVSCNYYGLRFSPE
jgi:hypothetical protein